MDQLKHLIKHDDIPHNKLKITNIKLSSKYRKSLKRLEEDTDELHYYAKNVFVLKFETYMCTVLHASFIYLNFTGIRSMSEVITCLDKFHKICSKFGMGRTILKV